MVPPPQIELLGAYLGDILNSPCYVDYHDRYRAGAGDTATSRAIATRYVFRSQACRSLAPDGAFEPLMQRMLERNPLPDGRTGLPAADESEWRAEVSQTLSPGTARPNIALALLNELPFSTNLSRAVPRRIAVYITRNDYDPDTGIITNRPGVTSWTLVSFGSKDFPVSKNRPGRRSLFPRRGGTAGASPRHQAPTYRIGPQRRIGRIVEPTWWRLSLTASSAAPSTNRQQTPRANTFFRGSRYPEGRPAE